MIVKKARYSRNSRLSSRNSPRRNNNYRSNGSYQRNGSFGSDNNLKSKVRGNPSQMLDKYLALAGSSLSSGDRIQAEYYFQFADHYSRVISESGNGVNILKNDSLSNISNDTLITESNAEKNINKDSVEQNNRISDNQDDENETNLESVAFLSGSADKK